MKELFGINASSGYGIGPVYCYKPNEYNIDQRNNVDTSYEKLKIEKAIKNSIEQLQNLKLKHIDNIEDKADIITAHISMIEDPDLKESIINKIELGNNAEWAVDETVKEYIDIFKNMDNEYFKERALDLQDIGKRILDNLMGNTENSLTEINDNIILVARELTPSDTLTMDKNKVMGIVTETGGKTSHTAIIARTLGIPAVTGIEKITDIIDDNQEIIIDGTIGKIILEPKKQQIEEYNKLIDERKAELVQEKSLIGCSTQTEDGYKIKLYCNIASVDDIQEVLTNDGEGIGLFRTEFLYMNRIKPPSEDEQYKVYNKIGNMLEGKEVIIRTLDVGGDKEISYINIEKELNPFLGNRAIRYCLQEQKLLLTQLKAILRASADTNIKVMFPMITSYNELIQAMSFLEKAKKELETRNIRYNKGIKIGIMIETPAAVFNSNHLAKEVDFFSIGSNDLIQYTCAVDRMNTKISYLYTPYNPAIIKSIKMVVDNAHREGIEVSICGEAASDETLLPLWISLGIDELSVVSKDVLSIRKYIRQISRDKTLINKAIELKNKDEIIKFLS
ncbi:phosphoenolpyruvate-protein phosphotransferase [Vallitalea longa]|uniref:Phosphoenolpyruvate-protein phosphotransferase n=1 Tax=Vallitalea longa TaxID=2936439 RepID=A0A9W5YAP8_9FIRM|nr:phosphoenolpyruvate--protein phosphotransferase [Vallitalea longa]GKX28494.1 phosphoenolpyruvate-protein phosphotransferase [Vallitalea longa]